MITLLLLLHINICSTFPIDNTDPLYGTAKLTGGVPTPSHYLERSNDKEPTQSLPSITSDFSLPFPVVHVTSEVRTVSLQITQDGVPIIRSIVNPVVFAKEPRQDAFFEPTEVEAPVSTPTPTSLVSNSNNSDSLITINPSVKHRNIHSKSQLNHQMPLIHKIQNDTNKKTSTEKSNNMDTNFAISNTSKVYKEISRKPKRISPFNDNINQSRKFEHGDKEFVPTFFQDKDNSKERLTEMAILVSKRQQKTTEDVLLSNEPGDSSSTSHKAGNQMDVLTNKSRKQLLVNIDGELPIEDREIGLVAELKSKTKFPEGLIHEKYENPVVIEPRDTAIESFWNTRDGYANKQSRHDDREFIIEKINKEGISQLMFNSKNTGMEKYPINPEINKSGNQTIFEKKMFPKNYQTQKDQLYPNLDLLESTSLEKQVPEAVLKSQEKLLLQASQENTKTDNTINIENNAELLASNVSRRNETSAAVNQGINGDIKSSSSHMIQGVLKSRALEPYVNLYDQPPSISPNEQISSPITEHLDRDLAPGCVAAIVLGVLLCALAAMGSLAFVVYNRHSGIRPKMLSSDRSCANSDSGGYFDDQCRVAYLNSQTDVSKGTTPEDLVSLDNDSFLNSLESMTIQNLWTDSIRHTKL